MNNRALLSIVFSLIVSNIFAQQKHEMRVVWIATVNNIDWTPGNEYEPYRQREAMLNMLDTFKCLNINAIIIQIRPTADAFYQSSIEKWSHFLTGEQGRPPYPYYDPLEFIIQEAHNRGIDVHVWLNPYRLLNNDSLHLLHKDNLFFKRPDIFIKYGKQYFFNPAKKETLEHIKNVVSDIVSRYDIDAVHIDDYFYPYPIRGEDFPDWEDFKADPRGFTDKNDWRRDNVNKAIEIISSTIKSIKPYVEFGVSPFGVWRNKSKDPQGSNTKALSNYDDLYADVLKWIKLRQIDYVMPQLYWEIGHKAAEYKTLVEWWNQYSDCANLYVGLYASNLANRSASKAWQQGNELVRQIAVNKQYENIKGIGLYSAVAIMNNRQGIADSLRNNIFKYPALVPPSQLTPKPVANAPKNGKIIFDYKYQKIHLLWDNANIVQNVDFKYYVIYKCIDKELVDISNPKNIIAVTKENCIDITDLLLDNYDKKIKFAISIINRYNVESTEILILEY